MSELFLASTVGEGILEPPVLVERLQPGFAGDAPFVELFLGSVRTSTTHPHANVLRVLESGVGGERPCRVLEFVEGEALSTLLMVARERGLTIGLREVCFIVQQVADGLANLHQARASHRGLNPSHVWISSGGEVKLIDTGGASRSEPPYLTPEQVRGRPADPRGDVFRLGLILYELLAGRPLFFDSAHPRAIHHIGDFDERELEPVPGCPPSLWDVLLQAIASEPEVRFPTARAFADTLRGFLVERELSVDHHDIAHLFARVFPTRRSCIEEWVGARSEALIDIVPLTSGRSFQSEPPPVLYPVEPPPPPDEALEGMPEKEEARPTPTPPRQTRPEDLQTRLLDEALGLIGGSAELAPLLVRLTRGCVARLGGRDDEESLAVLAARALVLAARLEEPRRFVLPTLAGVRALVGGAPELSELLSAVLLSGPEAGPPAGRAARALLSAAAFVAQVQSPEPGQGESARVLIRLRQDPRLAPAALEAIAAELDVSTMPPRVAAVGQHPLPLGEGGG
ncbi:serine/threonine protein kinase [Archangium violaceum]|uniref:serine/threonine protein kinase n=1 Tax=Archangium violaceum TaxID=83451 RepID=UPI00193B5F32|nr:serine/threonine-protein kinase [Archangium violaceum]QRK05886.1 serine/threonine protein kinase [Archangium violaceum]